MIKDIWHKPSETPEVFKSHPIIVVYEAGDEIEQMDSTEYSDLVGERYVNRWCYVDELIKESDSTRKALELAITGLKNCKTRDHIGAVCRTPEYVDKILEQIKTTLEQKDVK